MTSSARSTLAPLSGMPKLDMPTLRYCLKRVKQRGRRRCTLTNNEYVDTPGIRRLKALTPEEQLKVTRERGIHYLPYLALGLVPVYAALLQWVYRPRHRRYGAHLVFGLYTHSFLLLIVVIEAKLPPALATPLPCGLSFTSRSRLSACTEKHGARPSGVALF